MPKRFSDPAVKSVFAAYPKDVKRGLMRLRDIILSTAATLPETGGVIETLKWGQPSYLPKRNRVGSTLRIDAIKGQPGKYAMYYHCQSRLAEMFKEHYPQTFDYDGKRAIIFDAGDDLPEDELKHCAAMALTYHMHKRSV